MDTSMTANQSEITSLGSKFLSRSVVCLHQDLNNILIMDCILTSANIYTFGAQVMYWYAAISVLSPIYRPL